MALDDPVDQALAHSLPEPPTTLDVVLHVVSGLGVPLVGVAAALRDHFSAHDQTERVKVLFESFSDELKRLGGRVEDLERTFAVATAREALLAAVSESVQTASHTKIQRFSKVLATHSATTPASWEEAESLIHDLARLTDRDIQALGILYQNQHGLVYPNGTLPLDPNLYTELFSQLLAAVNSAGIYPDDFYSRCARLQGFGLAA